MAFVVASDPAVSGDDVVELCRGKIAKYKLPAIFHNGHSGIGIGMPGMVRRDGRRS